MNSNRIIYAGDPHGNFKAIVKSVLALKPEAVIILGDFGLTARLEIELEQIAGLSSVFWIPGNHDYDSPTLHSNLFESDYSANNLDGRVVNIGIQIFWEMAFRFTEHLSAVLLTRMGTYWKKDCENTPYF